jgi:putative transposase
MLRRTFKYRLYPSKAQVTRLNETLARCCELYNAALQERRDAWLINRVSINYYDQCQQLVEIKLIRPEYQCVYSQVLQDALRRVDRTFQAFFRRVKERKDKAGFPRFRAHKRYDSFTYTQRGFSLSGNKLTLSKVGKVRIKLHRPLEGKVKTCTIKREAGRWYACFVSECEPKPLPPCADSVGVDVGLTAFATLSSGTNIENPHWFKAAQPRLRIAQRKVARRQKGSNRRRKAVQLLQRVHVHIRNQRVSFHHQESRKLVNNYGLIAVEDLNVKGMARGMLAKSISDAGWSQFLRFIAYKAEDAGRFNPQVNPNGTSQECLCGGAVPKTLKERWHNCAVCGLSAPRDHVSALVIEARGLRVQALTSPVAECVA